MCVAVRDVRVKPALPFDEMSANSKRYLEASGEWELVVILGEAGILSFGIDEWDIITFWVRDKINTHNNNILLNGAWPQYLSVPVKGAFV